MLAEFVDRRPGLRTGPGSGSAEYVGTMLRAEYVFGPFIEGADILASSNAGHVSLGKLDARSLEEPK